MAPTEPVLELYNCQEEVPLDLRGLETALRLAFPKVLLAEPGGGQALLSELDMVEMSLLSDAAIGEAHAQFLDDPTPTDVITFQHGEILASAETAAREAAERAWPVERELLLYLIHGLLHLHGHLDHEPEDRTRMHRIQDEILDLVWPLSGAGVSVTTQSRPYSPTHTHTPTHTPRTDE